MTVRTLPFRIFRGYFAVPEFLRLLRLFAANNSPSVIVLRPCALRVLPSLMHRPASSDPVHPVNSVQKVLGICLVFAFPPVK
jgi:hypothetical protein